MVIYYMYDTVRIKGDSTSFLIQSEIQDGLENKH